MKTEGKKRHMDGASLSMTPEQGGILGYTAEARRRMTHMGRGVV